VLLLPLSAFCALDGLFGSPSTSAAWGFGTFGAIWFLVAVLLVAWWHEGREGLARGLSGKSVFAVRSGSYAGGRVSVVERGGLAVAMGEAGTKESALLDDDGLSGGAGA
jgi:hypothetical protein